MYLTFTVWRFFQQYLLVLDAQDEEKKVSCTLNHPLLPLSVHLFSNGKGYRLVDITEVTSPKVLPPVK